MVRLISLGSVEELAHWRVPNNQELPQPNFGSVGAGCKWHLDGHINAPARQRHAEVDG
jgi:hypothetical protein